MTSAESICYTLVNGGGSEELATESQIRADIEQNDVKIKGTVIITKKQYYSLQIKIYVIN